MPGGQTTDKIDGGCPESCAAFFDFKEVQFMDSQDSMILALQKYCGQRRKSTGLQSEPQGAPYFEMAGLQRRCNLPQ